MKDIVEQLRERAHLTKTTRFEAAVDEIKRLRDELSALKNQKATWEPIETAPKDGQSILLATPTGKIADGMWSRQYGVWAWPYVMVNPVYWRPLLTIPKPGEGNDFADAYQGAREEVAIWKKRALEAEALNRKFIAEINGPTHMGEPVATLPSVPDVDALAQYIIDSLQDEFDTEGITESDSGDALIRLTHAIEAVKEALKAAPKPGGE